MGLRPKLNVIFFYLMIHPQLTQKQIMSLTGYSQSNVSLMLQIMLDNDMVTKQTISGKNSSAYILKIQDFSLDYSSFLSGTKFQLILASLEAYLVPLQVLMKKKTPGSALLWMRIKEIMFLRIKQSDNRLNGYKQLIQKILNSDNEFLKREAFTLVPIDFAPESVAIENKLINIMIEDEIFFIKQKPSHSKILAYFYTRRILTQKILQDLTHFSAGVISESLRFFSNEMDIREIPPSQSKLKTKAKLYGLDFIHYSLQYFFINYNPKVCAYISRFQEILQELRQLPLQNFHQRGFTELCTFLDQYLIARLQRLKAVRHLMIQFIKNFYEFYGKICPDCLPKPPTEN